MHNLEWEHTNKTMHVVDKGLFQCFGDSHWV